MFKYFVIWVEIAFVAYNMYQHYLIRYPSIAFKFEDSGLIFLILPTGIIFFLWDWAKRRQFHNHKQKNSSTQQSHGIDVQADGTAEQTSPEDALRQQKMSKTGCTGRDRQIDDDGQADAACSRWNPGGTPKEKALANFSASA
jgi:hypothetical protein